MASHMHWKAGGVSVAGFDHEEDDIPCQDAHAYKIRNDGWLIAAVADGAGSARKSHIGAQAYVEALVNHFSAEPNLSSLPVGHVTDAFIVSVNTVTRELVETYASADISRSDFAATIVMVISNSDGGMFFHVGDGAGAALKLADPSEAAISEPQNGEYANETYFVTMDNWEDHLRVTPFDSGFDTVLLMSDGVTPMAMTKGCKSPFLSFVRPVIQYLLKVDAEVGQDALRNTLTLDKIRAVTGDDKTLFWASKPPLLQT